MEEETEEFTLETAEEVDAFVDAQGLAPMIKMLAAVVIDQLIGIADPDPATIVGMMAGFAEGMYEGYNHPRCVQSEAKRRFFELGKAAGREVVDSGMLHAEVEIMSGGSRVTKGQA